MADKRSSNFTHDEISLILAECAKRKSVLLAPTNTAETVKRKNEGWLEVTNALNAQNLSQVGRTVTQVKKKWRDLLSIARKDRKVICNPPSSGGALSRVSPYSTAIVDIIGDDSPTYGGIRGIETETGVGPPPSAVDEPPIVYLVQTPGGDDPLGTSDKFLSIQMNPIIDVTTLSTIPDQRNDQPMRLSPQPASIGPVVPSSCGPMDISQSDSLTCQISANVQRHLNLTNSKCDEGSIIRDKTGVITTETQGRPFKPTGVRQKLAATSQEQHFIEVKKERLAVENDILQFQKAKWEIEQQYYKKYLEYVKIKTILTQESLEYIRMKKRKLERELNNAM